MTGKLPGAENPGLVTSATRQRYHPERDTLGTHYRPCLSPRSSKRRWSPSRRGGYGHLPAAGAVARYSLCVSSGVASSGTATPLAGCPARVTPDHGSRAATACISLDLPRLE
jgi:hypothetical protein